VSPIERIADRASGAGAVIVIRPRLAADADAECKRLLVDEPSDAAVLGIDFSTQPSTWYDQWCDAVDADPAAAAVITTPDLADADDAPEALSVETVASPSNLTGVGVKSTPYLSEWSDPFVVVESLTVLLQYADPQIVYRFLHALTSRFRAADATGLVFLDATTQDDQTVELLKTLFDAVIEHEGEGEGEDGEWSAQIRDS